MRHFLTGLGILICLTLVAAMAGPHFIDWGGRRALFEKRIAQITGQPARIDGPIAVTLLPTPTLSLDQVKIGRADKAGFVPLEVERISGALAATALFRGEFVITEALIDGPVVRIDERGMAAFVAESKGPSRADPDAISIEKLQIRDGNVTIARAGREPLAITGLTSELEATSLLGPARGNGSMVLDGARRNLRFALGRIENGKARLKLLVEDHALALRLDVDGVALIDGSTRGFEGSAALTGNPGLDPDSKKQVPLRSNAKVKLAGDLLSLDDITVSLGGEPAPLTLTGAGSVSLAANPRVDLALSARSFDFDRPGPDGKPKLAVPADLIRQFQALNGATSSGPVLPDGKIDLSFGGLIIGGQTVLGARIVAEQTGNTLKIHSLEGELPGQTRVNFARDSLSDNGIISGLLQFESRDPERLNGWFNGVQRVVTAAASLRANVVLSSVRGGVSIDRIEMDRGATHLSGQGAYLLAVPGLRPAPRLTLALQSPRFDIDDIPAFAFGGERREEKPDLDFDVDIDAKRLVLEGKETGRLVVKARRDGDITSIERLAITELDGANLIASGTLGGGSRRVTLKLDAERVDGLAAIAEQVFPGSFTRSLRKRAALMSPALIVASLANDDADDSFVVSAEGRLARTDLQIGGKLAGKGDIDLDLSLSLRNADGAALARQIGAGTREVASPLPGAIRLTTHGNPRGALDLDLDVGLAGLASRVKGQIRIFQPFAPFEGTINAESADLGPLVAALDLDPAFAMTGTSGKLTGRVLSNLDQITITDFKATIGTMPAQGEIAFRISENGKIAGQVRVPTLELLPLASLALGPAHGPVAGARWSSAPLGKPVVPPLRGDLWIEAGTARLDAATQFDGAKFVFRFDENATSVEYAEFRAGQSRLTGDVFLKRSAATAALSSRLNWVGADMARLWPEGMKGNAEGEIQLTGTGDSVAKLAQSLSGSGNVRVRNLVVPALDPGALPRVLAGVAATATAGPVDAGTLSRRLDAELQRGPLNAPDVRASLVVMDGVARVTSVNIDRPEVRNEASGTFDIGRFALDIRMTSTASSAPDNWRGAPPRFTVQWLGLVASLRRNVSVDSLINGFMATSLQRDSDLLEIQQQDARERAGFNRRLRASQQERQRADEAARAEQLRLQNLKLREALEQPQTGTTPAPLNLLPDPAFPPAR